MVAEVSCPAPFSLRRLRMACLIGAMSGVLWQAAAPRAARAEGEDPAALAKITELNKKGLQAYDNLDFEEARKLLKQALEECTAAGLDKHPIRARTHIHMGAVLFGGFKQRDLAIKQFRRALEIEPDIKLTKSVATPEIQAAFDEAASQGPSAAPEATPNTEPASVTPPMPNPPAEAAAPAAMDETPPQPAVGAGMSHRAVTVGGRGQPVPIAVTLDDSVSGVSKVVLSYRVQGAAEFVARELTRSENGYSGEIPATATGGSNVAYFIEAQAADGSVVVAAGSSDQPFTVTLTPGRSTAGSKKDDDEDDDEDDEGPRFYFGLMLGSGFGYTTGHGEVNTGSKVDPAGFAPASLGHLALEVGYFLTPNLRLSLQTRFQTISAANGYKDVAATGQCGSDNYCSPAKGAIAFFAKLGWFFGSGSFHPYVTAAAGAGQIRHVVTFKNSLGPVCGTGGNETCTDTVLAGPVFVGPGAGLLFALTQNVGLVFELNSQLGFSNFTFNVDANLGVALRI